MVLGTPIEFTLYDDNDEIIATFRRARVPVQFGERAMDLAPQLNGEEGKEVLQALYQLIVEFYSEKFTVEELRKGADLLEMYAVVHAIVARAGELMPASPNPFPGSRKKGRKNGAV